VVVFFFASPSTTIMDNAKQNHRRVSGRAIIDGADDDDRERMRNRGTCNVYAGPNTTSPNARPLLLFMVSFARRCPGLGSLDEKTFASAACRASLDECPQTVLLVVSSSSSAPVAVVPRTQPRALREWTPRFRQSPLSITSSSSSTPVGVRTIMVFSFRGTSDSGGDRRFILLPVVSWSSPSSHTDDAGTAVCPIIIIIVIIRTMFLVIQPYTGWFQTRSQAIPYGTFFGLAGAHRFSRVDFVIPGCLPDVTPSTTITRNDVDEVVVSREALSS
jgi:hypothetical protein